MGGEELPGTGVAQALQAAVGKVGVGDLDGATVREGIACDLARDPVTASELGQQQRGTELATTRVGERKG
jgi:hypothetical protein